jgi:tRNA 2-thiouridine synthesizing protein C
MNSFLIISRAAPYGSAAAREALELALACALFDREVALLLLDDAVYQLLPDHSPAGIGQKNLAAMQQSLPLYDVEKIYVCQTSLEARGLTTESLALPVTPVDPQSLKALLREYEAIINV